MADYIRKNILCQAYVHAEVPIDFEDAVGTIEAQALPLITTRVKFFLYNEAAIEFVPDEGSVKSRITILGTLVLALQGISNYKDFREGIQLLYSDVQRVAEMATTETLFALKARGSQVLRTEHRVGIVGSLHRIICAIEATKLDIQERSTRARGEDLERIQDDIHRLIDSINNGEDLSLIAHELGELCSGIPLHPGPGRRDPNGGKYIPFYQDRRRKLLASTQTAKQARSKALHD